MNVSRLFCLGAVVWLVGCGKSEHEAASPAPVVEAMPAAPAPSPAVPAAPAPAPSKPALVLTPELENAVVVVRVAVAGTLMREQTGVILRPEVFSPPIPLETPRRYVAVLLPGHEESVLRDKSCNILVLRRRLDENNRPFVLMRPALLLHFDAASHVAVLQFTEDFPYQLEEGPVRVSGEGAEAEAMYLLQAALNQEQQQQTATLPRGPKGTGLTGAVDVSLLRARMADGGLKLAEGQPQAPGPVANAGSRLNVAAVLAGDGSLAGFAKPGAAPELQGFEKFVVPQVAELDLRYVMTGVEIESVGDHSKSLGYYRVRVKGAVSDPLNEYRTARLAVRNLATAEDFMPVANPQANQPAMEHEGEFDRCHMEADGSFSLNLRLPPEVQSASQVVQVEMLRASGEVAFRTAPFMVVSKRRGAGVYQSVVGAPGAEAPVTAEAPAKPGLVELTTESRILHGAPLCEGREVIFRLEGAPYWKRLSLAEGKWLPLPMAEEELAHCWVAGNKDAIFVLTPGAAEIRRYNVATLALEKTARLPEGISYQSLTAGCLSDDAPLAVLGDLGALACDPRELTVALSPNLKKEHDIKLNGKEVFLASGDGSVVWGWRPKESSERSFGTRFMYEGGLSGFSKEVSYTAILAKLGKQPTVALSCPWVGRRMDDSTGTPLTTSPCYYTVSRAQHGKDGSPATPPQCSFYSLYADMPWATVPVPEAGDVPLTAWSTFEERVWLDPCSLTFAIWHAERTLTLHTMDKAALPQPAVPVLLNYPDCHVPRGGSFHFKPQVLGGGTEVSVEETPEGFTLGADGTMDWQPQGDIVARKVNFGLRLAGSAPGQGACLIRLELNLDGQAPAVAVPASLSGESAETAVADAGSKKSSVPLVALTSHFYTSERPILAVQPGLNDYLGLLLVDRTLALLSLKDWKVEGSQALGTGAAAFMAGDMVFLYNSITRELTRHSLPDFRETHRQSMPSGSRLIALGVGEKPVGPVTLVLEAEVKIPARGNLGPGVEKERSVLILDKETLAAARWAAYTPSKVLSKKDPYNPPPKLANFFHDKELPVQLPTSNDGRLVSFSKGVLMVSPALTVDFIYRTVLLDYHQEKRTPATTPTGDRLFIRGKMYLSADLPAIPICDGSAAALSRCGDYVAWLKVENDGRKQIRLSSANDGRPLLGLAGVELLKLYDGEEHYQRQVLTPMGDKNLLAVLSRGGTQLQAIDLDLAAAFLATEPQSAYVTSHPFPIVAEGRTLDYQVTVSNPAAVSRYELRDRTPGAGITPDGHLTYRAPAQLKESQQENIAIVIRLKNGETALHQFPVYVIAVAAAAKNATK